ncbi:DUF998 domain-containing protein [Weeksellaceae bacterium KMM 9713]|uniref:DUF998 domain-containing protein n=1 Tax=Profundicola chukchiensis TaxID=2961959 RepID=A0A9X4MX54_9FLAO|nr:DUF998 domain-containing protein [Profundicola chukchiensis]MDG4945738.1 DUF998 domain-containing protein [Profundicola chukchiensis]
MLLFIASCVAGGLLIEDYNVNRQFISETFAIDTAYGFWLRFLGYIPSGILLTWFCFLGVRYFPTSSMIKVGFYGVGIFYGIGTVVVSIFPCDSGCNPEFINPSMSQVIHNLSALMIYTFVPISIIIAGIGLSKFSNYKSFAYISIALGLLSAVFVFIFISGLTSAYVGLYQRIIELLILVWFVVCAFKIRGTV